MTRIAIMRIKNNRSKLDAWQQQWPFGWMMDTNNDTISEWSTKITTSSYSYQVALPSKLSLANMDLIPHEPCLPLTSIRRWSIPVSSFCSPQHHLHFCTLIAFQPMVSRLQHETDTAVYSNTAWSMDTDKGKSMWHIGKEKQQLIDIVSLWSSCSDIGFFNGDWIQHIVLWWRWNKCIMRSKFFKGTYDHLAMTGLDEKDFYDGICLVKVDMGFGLHLWCWVTTMI